MSFIVSLCNLILNNDLVYQLVYKIPYILMIGSHELICTGSPHIPLSLIPFIQAQLLGPILFLSRSLKESLGQKLFEVVLAFLLSVLIFVI